MWYVCYYFYLFFIGLVYLLVDAWRFAGSQPAVPAFWPAVRSRDWLVPYRRSSGKKITLFNRTSNKPETLIEILYKKCEFMYRFLINSLIAWKIIKKKKWWHKSSFWFLPQNCHRLCLQKDSTLRSQVSRGMAIFIRSVKSVLRLGTPSLV